MPRRKTKKTEDGFGVGGCSMCEDFDLTFGQQGHGGVRWCAECLQASFGWFQLDEGTRVKVMALFATLAVTPEVRKLMAQAATLTPEQKKAHSIGEARYRSVMADIAERRGY